MDDFTVLVSTAGILAVVLIAIVLMVRKSRSRPVDRDKNLRTLIGASGIAERDRNIAAAQRKREVELQEYLRKE